MGKKEVKKLSFELNEDMLGILKKEFDVKEVVDHFERSIAEKDPDEANQDVFDKYGQSLAHRALQLGDEYSDRTYEVMLEMIDRTGSYKFPLLPQRFLEIAYLSIQDLFAFPVHINSNDILCYEIVDCKVFEELKSKCPGKTLDEVPCKAACINLIKTIVGHFDLDVNIDAINEPLENKRCVFTIHKI
jgi:hypothetical protein